MSNGRKETVATRRKINYVVYVDDYEVPLSSFLDFITPCTDYSLSSKIAYRLDSRDSCPWSDCAPCSKLNNAKRTCAVHMIYHAALTHAHL